MPTPPSNPPQTSVLEPEIEPLPGFQTLLRLLQDVVDPRQAGKVAYPIGEVLFIALCSMISSYDHFTEMEMFAVEKAKWLSGYIPMANGAPSHDVFRNVLSIIEPTAMQDILAAWLPSREEPRQICIDGKSLRGSAAPSRNQAMVHILRAWVSGHSLSIAYEPCTEKANEIEALPRLLESIDLHNAVVTIDAMGTHTHIAQQINQGGGQYIFALKGNQPTALQAVIEHFEQRLQANSLLEPHAHGVSSQQIEAFVAAGQKLNAQALSEQLATAEATLAGFESLVQIQHTHGRYEERHFTLARGLDWWPKSWLWAGLSSAIEVVRKTHRGGSQKSDELSVETIYYLTSMNEPLQTTAAAITKHWGVENTCHHTLDVTYGEDHCQVRDPRAAVNLSILRDISAFALRNHPKKATVRSKRKLAAISDKFRSAVIDALVHT
jgi:predicted transposase YbfD/YdcC